MSEYADGVGAMMQIVGVLFGALWFGRCVQWVLRWFGLGT